MLSDDVAAGGMFRRMGYFSHDHAGFVIILSLILAGGLSSLIAGGNNFGEAFDGDNIEANQAGNMISEAFSDSDAGGPQFTIVFTHSEWNATNSSFQAALEDAIAPLVADQRIQNVSTPYNTPPIMAVSLISDNGTHALAIITFSDEADTKQDYPEIAELLNCGELECWKTHGVALDWTFDEKLLNDLIHAEKVSAPLILLILLFVFGSLVAALLPLAISIPTVISAVGIIFLLSNHMDVNNYALNIISLIGIGVSIDYSLFIVNRFREELGKGNEVREAIATTSATAGKAVFYSGITVGIGLMGMLFFTGTGLPSMGIGGILAVSLAVFFSTTFLMAVLSLLGERVNKGKIPFINKKSESQESGEGAWKKLAEAVMRRPVTFLIPVLLLLLAAGAPFLQLQLGLGGIELLPPDEEVRIGAEIHEQEWSDYGGATLYLAANLSGQERFSNDTIQYMHAYASEIQARDDVTSVISIYHPTPNMTANDVAAMYAAPEQYWPAEISLLVEDTSTESFSLIIVSYSVDPGSEESNELVRDLKSMDEGEEYEILVGGWGAMSVDVIKIVKDNMWKAVTMILLTTAVLIYIQVGSVIIPIKAVVMNILSLTASFGMLVFFFQQGHGLDQLLNFTPQPVDPTAPVIMFCIVFGLSMDYEVLMLSRIHEAWLETGDNTLAVSTGLQQTGRLITGAAAVMVVVFASFALAEVQLIKAIGLGLAMAILIDATLIRAIVVPATMRLMGRANWWSPSWLNFGKNSSEKAAFAATAATTAATDVSDSTAITESIDTTDSS